jgi:hypothetical protein
MTLSLLEKLPLGTIIAWNKLDDAGYPENWVECDGRTIQFGPWSGLSTPDINTSNRFLRGGTIEQAFELEEDAFQEHYHEHYHDYYEYDKAQPGRTYGDGDGTPRYITFSSFYGSTQGAEHGKIVAGDKVTTARFATETRPKNIKVVYLMKCWHVGFSPIYDF